LTPYTTGQEPDLYFFRDTNGNEVDLLLARGSELIPVEIKSSETYSPDFVRGIEYFKKTAGQDLKGFVIYAGDRGQRIGQSMLCGFAEAGHAVLK
jgi:hypothetical protein